MLFVILSFFFIQLKFQEYPQSKAAHFYKESITMKIDKGCFYVNGTYYLSSPADDTLLLFYPFPSGPEFRCADSILVYNLSSGDTIKMLNSEKDKIVFLFPMRGGQEETIQISYSQELYSNKARYILKSTLAWREPLKEAYYQLIVPDDIRISSFSYPPDDSLQAGSEWVYYWRRFDFMPPEDLIFHFRKAEDN
jgi:hypothetical protein